MNSPEAVANIIKARESNEFTDYAFSCEGQHFPVHKIVICSQSSVFRAACLGPFEVSVPPTRRYRSTRPSARYLRRGTSTAQESNGVYEIKDFPPDMVRRMVKYLYTGSYDDDPAVLSPDEDKDISDEPQQAPPAPLILHAVMFSLADKYIIPNLQARSVKRYSQELKRGQSADAVPFLQSVPSVYDLTPSGARELRDLARDFAREHLPGWLGTLPAVKEAYEEVSTQVPDFTKDLLDSFLWQPLLGECDNCGRGKRVPLVTLQCRCKKCGRGGARADKAVEGY